MNVAIALVGIGILGLLALAAAAIGEALADGRRDIPVGRTGRYRSVPADGVRPAPPPRPPERCR